LERGLVSADEVGLGIQAMPDFAAIDATGTRSRCLKELARPG
jgi:hypothetical protein